MAPYDTMIPSIRWKLVGKRGESARPPNLCGFGDTCNEDAVEKHAKSNMGRIKIRCHIKIPPSTCFLLLAACMLLLRFRL